MRAFKDTEDPDEAHACKELCEAAAVIRWRTSFESEGASADADGTGEGAGTAAGFGLEALNAQSQGFCSSNAQRNSRS